MRVITIRFFSNIRSCVGFLCWWSVDTVIYYCNCRTRVPVACIYSEKNNNK